MNLIECQQIDFNNIKSTKHNGIQTIFNFTDFESLTYLLLMKNGQVTECDENNEIIFSSDIDYVCNDKHKFPLLLFTGNELKKCINVKINYPATYMERVRYLWQDRIKFGQLIKHESKFISCDLAKIEIERNMYYIKKLTNKEIINYDFCTKTIEYVKSNDKLTSKLSEKIPGLMALLDEQTLAKCFQEQFDGLVKIYEYVLNNRLIIFLSITVVINAMTKFVLGLEKTQNKNDKHNVLMDLVSIFVINDINKSLENMLKD